MCTWIDQTFNEALRLAVSWSRLALIIRYLAQMSIHTGDVLQEDWERYLCHAGHDTDSALISYIRKEWRIKIPVFKEKQVKVNDYGFNKVILSFEYRSNEPLADVIRGELENFTKANALYIELTNASLYKREDIAAVRSLLTHYKVQGLIYSDLTNIRDVFTLYEDLKELQQSIGVPLEFLGGNAYGMGVASALSACRAGISKIHASVGGMGNYVPLEEIWMANKQFLNGSKPPGNFADCCRKIMGCLHLDVPRNKPIIGKDIFSHESGLHVDGVTKNPALYEAFSPEEVGLTRNLVIGKHSGSAALRYKLKEWELYLDKQQTQKLLTAVRQVAAGQKAAVTDFQLKELYLKTLKERLI